MAGAEDGATGNAPWPVRALRGLGQALLRIPRVWAFAPALLWAALIWFLSSRAPPSIGVEGDLGGVLANSAHAFEYGVLAVWLALAAPRQDGWPVLDRCAVGAILLAVLLYAAGDEFHQSFTPHRDPSAFDVLTDLVGASATLACIATIGGPRASPRAFGWRFALGLLACAVAAALANFVPPLFPDQAWL
jgi:hypothetical protein